MEPEGVIEWQAKAAEQFNQHEQRSDGARVARSLAEGLNILRESFYGRIHHDVEQIIGKDSMLMPVSELKTAKLTKTEIELYQIAESVATVKEQKYVGDDDWYLHWLALLRLEASAGEVGGVKRLAEYTSQAPDDRRLAFTDVLAETMRESMQAPLVVFRLFPLAIGITTALAFGDHQRAAQTRDQQIAVLPAITDCRECRGAVLENGELCGRCGNPLWKSEWLTAAD